MQSPGQSTETYTNRQKEAEIGFDSERNEEAREWD